jgi:hypothetical protein
MNVFVNEEGLVGIEAGFDRSVFCGARGSESSAVMVTALLRSGEYVLGTDMIKIVNNNMRCVATFASYWLEGGCGKPDWCGGFDLDKNTVINLVDFSMLDNCCIEMITE